MATHSGPIVPERSGPQRSAGGPVGIRSPRRNRPVAIFSAPPPAFRYGPKARAQPARHHFRAPPSSVPSRVRSASLVIRVPSDPFGRATASDVSGPRKRGARAAARAVQSEGRERKPRVAPLGRRRSMIGRRLTGLARMRQHHAGGLPSARRRTGAARPVVSNARLWRGGRIGRGSAVAQVAEGINPARPPPARPRSQGAPDPEAGAKGTREQMPRTGGSDMAAPAFRGDQAQPISHPRALRGGDRRTARPGGRLDLRRDQRGSREPKLRQGRRLSAPGIRRGARRRP